MKDFNVSRAKKYCHLIQIMFPIKRNYVDTIETSGTYVLYCTFSFIIYFEACIRWCIFI